jgi:hypothetical protein
MAVVWNMGSIGLDNSIGGLFSGHDPHTGPTVETARIANTPARTNDKHIHTHTELLRQWQPVWATQV